MRHLVSRLIRAFKDKEYRHAYVDEFSNASIATQIKVLREQRHWSQKELAEEAGMAQPRISALENVNYDRWSVNTLRRLAEAFDVTLCVSFETFGKRLIDIDRFSRDNLERLAFDKDPVFQVAGKQTGVESRALAEGYKEANQPVGKVIDLFAAKGQRMGLVEGWARFATTERQEWGGLERETAIS